MSKANIQGLDRTQLDPAAAPRHLDISPRPHSRHGTAACLEVATGTTATRGGVTFRAADGRRPSAALNITPPRVGGDLPGGPDLERSEQAGGAVADVVVGLMLENALAQRQDRLRSVQSLVSRPCS